MQHTTANANTSATAAIVTLFLLNIAVPSRIFLCGRGWDNERAAPVIFRISSSLTKSNSQYSSYEYYDFDFELGGKRFNALINIGVDKEGNRYFYYINKIHTVGGIAQPNGTHSQTNNMYNNNISQNNEYVK